MRGRIAIAAVSLLLGCLHQPPAPPGPDAVGVLAEADALSRNHSGPAARRLYRQVLREHRGTPAAAAALYGLGQLYVDPESGLRDYDAAQVAFSRLVSEYPDGPYVREARAWRAALGELRRTQGEASRLHHDLERLKELDMEQEEP